MSLMMLTKLKKTKLFPILAPSSEIDHPLGSSPTNPQAFHQPSTRKKLNNWLGNQKFYIPYLGQIKFHNLLPYQTLLHLWLRR